MDILTIIKRVAIVILVCFSLNSFGQLSKVSKNNPSYDRKAVHFGFTIGFNKLDFVMRKSGYFLSNQDSIFSIENSAGYGFHLGPVTNFRLGRYFDARCLLNLTFNYRMLHYAMNDFNSLPSSTITDMKIESIFIEVPLLIKYKAKRINNYRPYIIAGVNPKLDLSARKEIKDEDYRVRLRNYDLYYEVGLGIDYYLPFFKFSTELKFSFGLNNLIVPDGKSYSKSIDKLTSKLLVVSFHFE